MTAFPPRSTEPMGVLRPALARAVRPVVALLAALLVLGSLGVAPLPTARASAATPTIAVTATSTSTSALEVRWVPSAGYSAQAWSLNVLEDASGRSWGQRTACKDCRSTVIDGLSAGVAYRIVVIGWGDTVASGEARATVSSASCAGVTGTCVTVGAGTRPAAAHVGQGFLFGTTAATDMAAVTALAPRSWRIAPHTPDSFARARAAGGDITLILSDSWRAYVKDNGLLPGTNPWDDFAAYRAFVTSTVRRHINLGMLPEYWEVQNEPDGNNIYGLLSPATRPLVLEQHRVAHDAIRALLPDARIVGPALAKFRYRDALATVDLESFVDFAASNGLRFDIAWHENGNNVLGQYDGDPKSLVGHVDMVRQLIADRPALGQPRILINEFGAPWNFDQPGASVGYLAALETAQVSGANRACFPIRVGLTTYSTCHSEPGLLDGLLLPDGSKADNYLVHQAYAAMTGARLQTSTTDRSTSALSAQDGGTVRTLVGRHQSCTQGANQGCPLLWKPGQTGTALTVKLPCADGGTYDVRVERIDDLAPTAATAITVLASKMTCSGGALSVKLPGLADGAVYSVVSTG